jgi:hypothetical protein
VAGMTANAAARAPADAISNKYLFMCISPFTFRHSLMYAHVSVNEPFR